MFFCAFLLLLHLVVTSASYGTSTRQHTLWQGHLPRESALKVPGGNPAYHCDFPFSSLFQIHSMDIIPNPPQRGRYLDVKIVGNFTEDPGPDMEYMVLTGSADGPHYAEMGPLWKLVRIAQDEEGKGESQKYPPSQGMASMSASIPITSSLSEGDHRVMVRGQVKNGNWPVILFCVFATVEFETPSSVLDD